MVNAGAGSRQSAQSRTARAVGRPQRAHIWAIQGKAASHATHKNRAPGRRHERHDGGKIRSASVRIG